MVTHSNACLAWLVFAVVVMPVESDADQPGLDNPGAFYSRPALLEDLSRLDAACDTKSEYSSDDRVVELTYHWIYYHARSCVKDPHGNSDICDAQLFSAENGVCADLGAVRLGVIQIDDGYFPKFRRRGGKKSEFPVYLSGEKHGIAIYEWQNSVKIESID
jgi:hypothetical protein